MTPTIRKQDVDAAVYNLKAVVMETGLKPPTLRAWERRYGFPNPERTEGGHRQYSQRDIDTLKWLVDRQEEGMSISHAIDLLHSLLEQGEDPVTASRQASAKSVRASGPVVTGTQMDELRKEWLEACLVFDRPRAELILSRAFALFTPEAVSFELLRKAVAEAGERWYAGKITVQQEHFISAMAIQRLELLIASAAPPTRRERLIVATAPQDYHIFSPLLLTFLLRRQGLEVVYLGANVPALELEETIKHVQPDLVVGSAQLLHTAAALKDVARTVQPRGAMMAYGGLIFNVVPALRNYIPGHFVGEDLQVALETIDRLLVERPQAPTPLEPAPAYERAHAHFAERRPLIEAHVWGTFTTTNRPTAQLAQVNQELAQSILAALALGDIRLLGSDMDWVEYLFTSYRWPRELLVGYLIAYWQAARIHLNEAGQPVLDWLAELTDALRPYANGRGRAHG